MNTKKKNDTYELAGTVKDTSKKVKKLKSKKRYYLKVVAYNGSRAGAMSGVVSAKTKK